MKRFTAFFRRASVALNLDVRFNARFGRVSISASPTRRGYHFAIPFSGFMVFENPTQFDVGAGIPRPIAWIIDLGGENPPLHCLAHYFFNCHKPTSKLKAPLARRKRGIFIHCGLYSCLSERLFTLERLSRVFGDAERPDHFGFFHTIRGWFDIWRVLRWRQR